MIFGPDPLGEKLTVDFRSIYATILDGWLNCASEKVLDARYEGLGLL
jgi:hypothetical protein